MRRAALFLGVFTFPAALLAAPTVGSGALSSERPQLSETAPPPVLTYGLCNAPQNADDFASSPVAVQEDSCNYFQEFQATSPNTNYGSSCGGFTVAFGPIGDLKLNWKRYHLKAMWGDAPPTQANCALSRLAAVAWGWRCDDAACTTGAWERIGNPKSQKGTWNTTSQVCYIDIGFVAPLDRVYKTLNVDVIASQTQGQTTVRRRAKGWIHASRGNGKCFSATVKPRP